MKVLQRDESRDKKLIADYRQKEDGAWKWKMWELSHRHEISTTRIYQILDYYNTPRRGRKGKNDRHTKAHKSGKN